MSAGGSPARPRRLFVALPIDLEWRAALAGVQREQEHRAPGRFRWVATDLMHLTVHFLGNQPELRIAAIRTALTVATALFRPIDARLGECGYFGARRAPRVLWVAVQDPLNQITRLREAFLKELVSAEIEVEQSTYVPHLTIGRARFQSRGVYAGAPPAPPPLVTRFDTVELVESQLLAKGPRYTVIDTYSLLGRSGRPLDTAAQTLSESK